MADTISKNDSVSRVAIDLMNIAATAEMDSKKNERATKEYWLKLYRQCWKAANGNSLASILEDEQRRQ